jgi:integrase/recombinase XerD
MMPFTAEELAKIHNACGKYPDRPPGRRARVRAFVLLLTHTGLRIRDVTMLTKDKISDGRVLLRTAKTGQAVQLPLPVDVVEAILPLGFQMFSSGNGTPKSSVAAWERSLKTLFKLAGVKGRAHMFRDSMAVKLLLNGISIEDVAAVLGNSARIVEKHYAPWVKVRQDRLEESVRRAWSLAT